MNIKSERLKKLEVELEDLEQWLKLGLVPKKDIDKHKEEINSIKGKINEEKDRLRFLKENGDLEEYVIPKKTPARQVYHDAHTMPDESDNNMTDAGLDMETEGGFDTESGTETNSGDDSTMIDEEEDPFSDRNRWKRGIMEDPDSDNW